MVNGYKFSKNKVSKIFIAGALATLVTLSSMNVFAKPGQKLTDKFNNNENTPANDSQILAPDYKSIIDKAIKAGYKNYTGNDVDITPQMSNAPASKIADNYFGYAGKSIIWDDKTDSYQWDFEINEQALYSLSVDYLAIESLGGIAPIRAIMIDNKVFFSEGYNIKFYKLWKDSKDIKYNINGDEINSLQEQKVLWQTLMLKDVKGLISGDLLFPLDAGKHKITMIYEDGPLAIGNIKFISPKLIDSYENVYSAYKNKNNADITETIRVEAESLNIKNDTSIRRSYDGDPSCTPFEYGKVRLNSVSGRYWKKANQEAKWSFEVKNPGLYKIAMRYLEVNGEGLNSYRDIKIDGKIPFREFENYRFTYDKEWQTKALGKDEKTPYLIYLDSGMHEISMSVSLGNMAVIVKEIEDLNSDLSMVIRNIIKVTGSEPDLNFHYELDKKITTLINDLGLLEKKLVKLSNMLNNESNGKLTATSSSFLSIADGLRENIENPDIIPTRLNDLISNQETISQWYIALQEQPLSIDYLEIISPEKAITPVKSNALERFYATYSNFISSFFKDYNNINLIENASDKKIINVWAARGREWSEIIQRMSDEDFSSKNNIVAKINLMPAGSMGVGGSSPLLLAITSGKTPDVVLGSDSLTPVELAIRGATYDLNKFSNFEEVKSRFLDGAFAPLKYNNGIYALPDTQDFQVMFYRKDIFNDLKLSPPKTWDELYRYVLPILKQSNYDFYYSGGLYPYLFQEGGSPYSNDGKLSALSSEKGYKAFVKWVQNYTIYELPRTANFFIHFRVGDIPIGTGSFNDYVFFSVAAPELYGKWGIVPIPGTKREDGVIDHSAGGGITTNFILNNTKNKDESWKYLDWWTSTETQIKFGNDVESTIGVEARWNTANIEALKRLPWNKEDLEVILESHKWYKEAMVVPGGYMTGRQITNAWTRVVMNDKNERDSLEKAVKDIDKELFKKQKQYAVINKD